MLKRISVANFKGFPLASGMELGNFQSFPKIMTVLTNTACAVWNSSIGKKTVVAVTGLIFIGFLAGHLSGNMLLFAGQHAFNEYAHFLHHAGHGALIWVARFVLLGSLILHVVATIQLTKQNRASRTRYQNENSLRATKSSKIMIWSGLTVLAFIIYHILHFTTRSTSAELARIVNTYDEHGHKDAYSMVIAGFQNIPTVLFYVIAMTLLCSHLSHGFASAFQTLGFRSQKTRDLLKHAGTAYSILIWIGFVSIPVAILFFGLGQ